MRPLEQLTELSGTGIDVAELTEPVGNGMGVVWESHLATRYVYEGIRVLGQRGQFRTDLTELSDTSTGSRDERLTELTKLSDTSTTLDETCLKTPGIEKFVPKRTQPWRYTRI